MALKPKLLQFDPSLVNFKYYKKIIKQQFAAIFRAEFWFKQMKF